MLKELEAVPACVTVTLVDGLVLSRSAFDHSMNYRSVVAFGKARKLHDSQQKLSSLRIMSEHLIAGRWDEVRLPSNKELNSTTVLAFCIEEASTKVRTGPPLDRKEDYKLPVWAGVLPLATSAGSPEPDDGLVEGISIPAYVAAYDRRLKGGRARVTDKEART
jgi:hypothetical protein